MITELDSIIEGKGEVKGIVFHQMRKHSDFYIYKAVNENSVYYECFERRKVAVCIDFQKRIYSETEFKEVYPKAKDFGVWAFSTPDWHIAKKKSHERFVKKEVGNG